MCIVAFAWQVIPNLPLALISNRDEVYHRPTQALSEWQGIFAGRDLQSGGTWLGVSKTGRWAVITNYRDGHDKRQYLTSRGTLVQQFLHGNDVPIRYLQQLEPQQHDYAGFNLIVGDQQQVAYMSNRGESPQCLAQGVYVVSNGLMSEHWAKVEHLRTRFTQEWLTLAQARATQETMLDESLLTATWNILQDTRQQTDDKLPNTGVGLTWERLLSSTFIQSEHYGTRCSNILMMSPQHLEWIEKIQAGEQHGHLTKMYHQFF